MVSLALGACLGGNGTLVGASANLVALCMAERRNVCISFIDFFKVGFPLMIMSIVFATFYITAWFLLDRPGVLLVTSSIGVMLYLKLIVPNREDRVVEGRTPAEDPVH